MSIDFNRSLHFQRYVTNVTDVWQCFDTRISARCCSCETVGTMACSSLLFVQQSLASWVCDVIAGCFAFVVVQSRPQLTEPTRWYYEVGVCGRCHCGCVERKRERVREG